MRRPAHARIAVAVGILATSIAGCRGPAQWRYEESLETTPAPATHAIHDERLEVLMRDLDGLRDQRLPQVIDVRAEEARQAREVARVAAAMADSAQQIRDAAPLSLSASERDAFLALADRLSALCTALADEAVRDDAAGRRARLREIDATCDQCHGRFRIRQDPDAVR